MRSRGSGLAAKQSEKTVVAGSCGERVVRVTLLLSVAGQPPPSTLLCFHSALATSLLLLHHPNSPSGPLLDAPPPLYLQLSISSLHLSLPFHTTANTFSSLTPYWSPCTFHIMHAQIQSPEQGFEPATSHARGHAHPCEP